MNTLGFKGVFCIYFCKGEEMRAKIVKQIRKYLRDMYPNLEEENPVAFTRMCNALKNEYQKTSVDVKNKKEKE